jgi:hypothetical protein
MTESRRNHTATLLPNGKVLIAGGYTEGGGDKPVASAELYDPATQTFTPTGNLHEGRAYHAAILLKDGRVLLVGGQGEPPSPLAPAMLDTAEYYDLASGVFAFQALAFPQSNSVLLDQGSEVQSIGGTLISPNVQSYSGSGAWQIAPSLNQARFGHQVIRIGEAIGLVTGGYTVDAQGRTIVLATIEQKDGLGYAWRVISGGAKCPGNSGCLLSPRTFHTATYLGGTTVLIAGGQDELFADLGTTELYDTFTGVSVAGPEIIPRSQHTATVFKRP